MKTVALHPLGGTGNQLFRAAYALALCEQNGHELRMSPSILQKIFTLGGIAPSIPDGTEDIVIDGYRQTQADLIYTRRDCRRWFTIKPELVERLERFKCNGPVAHIRRGDYAGAGYPVISESAVYRAFQMFPAILWVSEERAKTSDDFKDDLSMLPDFYRLMTAPFLIRANSTFSFWAGVLSHGLVFSPRIDGLAGGIEHDNVPYEEGNHCRCADLAMVTDLHLPE